MTAVPIGNDLRTNYLTINIKHNTQKVAHFKILAKMNRKKKQNIAVGEHVS